MFKWLSTFLLIWFIYAVRHVFPPFIVGGIVAYLLLPVVKALADRTKMKLSHAVACFYVTGVIVGSIVCWMFLPVLIEQFQALIEQREFIIGNLVRQASDTFAWKLNVEESTHNIMVSFEENFGRPQEIMHLGGLLSQGLLYVLVCFVSSIYFIVDSQRVGQFFLRFVPENRRVMAVNLSSQMNDMLSRYVRGQLLLIVLMSSVAYVFLHFVMQMRYALPIAIVSGFLEIIPVLGPILATTAATVVGFSQFGATPALYIVVFYTLARWFEDYVIVPKVIGHAVELHPLVVIFAVLCGEVMAGALGMLIAIPVAASIKVFLDVVKPESPPVMVLAEEIDTNQ